MALGLAEHPGHSGRAPGLGGTWSGRCSAWSRSCPSPQGGGAGHCAQAGGTHLAWGAHRMMPVISWPHTAQAQPGIWRCPSSLQQLQASLGNATGTQTPRHQVGEPAPAAPRLRGSCLTPPKPWLCDKQTFTSCSHRGCRRQLSCHPGQPLTSRGKGSSALGLS